MQRKYKAGLILLVILFLAPHLSQGKVLISEIMYDPSGSDPGHEWIEVVNESDTMLDMSQFKLFEAKTNHKIKSVSGGSFLQPHATGVITQDASKFLADNVHFSGVIFSSSFSLSNTGETFSIRDGNLTDLDTVTYSVSAGAAGDGQTLHRSGVSLVAGDSHPGVYPEPADKPKPVAEKKEIAPAVTKSSTEITSSKIVAKADTNVDVQLVPAATSTIALTRSHTSKTGWVLYLVGAIALALLSSGAALLLTGRNRMEREETVAEKAKSFEIIE